jgi:hypothetical protein
MYSGLEITKFSGRIMGAHQKLDRVARRHLKQFLVNEYFPPISDILRFEGRSGPDGIKMKSPGRNEPWHYLNPFDSDTEHFDENVTIHYSSLVSALKNKNKERAAFEAAWLAHTVVDGMTPPHHFPYTETIEAMRINGNSSRTSKVQKVMFVGENRIKTLKNMYAVYGPRGLFVAHFSFEHGSGIIIRPLRLPDAKPTKKEIEDVLVTKPQEFFLLRSREIAALDMFERYLKNGWTTKLANDIRHTMAPTMAKTITLLWYKAAKEASL